MYVWYFDGDAQMRRAPIMLSLLWTALILLAVEAGTPQFLCTGPDGHAAVEEILCGCSESGFDSCAGPDTLDSPLVVAPSTSLPGSTSFNISAVPGDGCTDTLLRFHDISVAPVRSALPSPTLAPHRTIFQGRQSSVYPPTSAFPEAYVGPPAPLERYTTLLI